MGHVRNSAHRAIVEESRLLALKSQAVAAQSRAQLEGVWVAIDEGRKLLRQCRATLTRHASRP